MVRMALHFAFHSFQVHSFLDFPSFRTTYPFHLIVLTRNGCALQVNEEFFGGRNKQCFGTAWVLLCYCFGGGADGSFGRALFTPHPLPKKHVQIMVLFENASH